MARVNEYRVETLVILSVITGGVEKFYEKLAPVCWWMRISPVRYCERTFRSFFYLDDIYACEISSTFVESIAFPIKNYFS